MTEKTAERIWREATGKKADRVRRLPTGSCNYVFFVQAEGRKHILRMALRENAEILKGSLYWIERLGVLNLSIPKLISANLESEMPYAILSYIEGCDLGHAYAGLSEDEKRGIAQEVVRVQKSIAGFPMADGYGYLSSYEDPRRKESWKAVVAGHVDRSRSRIRENRIFDESYVDRVEGLLPGYEDYFSLIRPIPFLDDATTKNVLVQDGRFSGIVDLDWICFGDSLYTIALTKMALLSSNSSLSYIDYLLAEENPSPAQSRVLDFYTLVFCVDFMSEAGMKFNKESVPPVSQNVIAGLQNLFETLYESCAEPS